MLATRKQGFAERLPKIEAAAQSQDRGLVALGAKRDAIVTDLQRAESQDDPQALANAHEQALLERLQRVQQTLQQLGDDPDAAPARERARMAAGVLTWQLAQAFPDRLWQAKKGLQAIDQQLDQARRHEAELAQAEKDEPARFGAFGERIPVLAKRIDTLLPQVAALTSEQQVALQNIAVAALERQKDRLKEYTVQARFAVAQLYDQARSSEHASQP
jgi:hypothetical protein